MFVPGMKEAKAPSGSAVKFKYPISASKVVSKSGPQGAVSKPDTCAGGVRHRSGIVVTKGGGVLDVVLEVDALLERPDIVVGLR